MVSLINKVPQDEDWQTLWDLGNLSDNIVKRPLFGHIKHKDDSMSTLIYVHKFGVKGGIHGRAGGRLFQLEAFQLYSLFAFVHDVPNINLEKSEENFT